MSQEWDKYPSEPVIRFVARNYYKMDRHSVKILDFGCDGGSHTWFLVKEGFDVYAFSGSKSAVHRVSERLGQEGLSVDVRVGDALELDYIGGIFECVIDGATIYANQMQNIINMYKEVYRLLKQGGKLFLVSFTTGTTGYGIGKEVEKNTFCDITEGSLVGTGTLHFYEEGELKEMSEEIGFRDIVVDIMRFTDRGNVVEEFLVQAEK